MTDALQTWYPERRPDFEGPGDYAAWIVASDKPAGGGASGPSFAAWRVVDLDDDDFRLDMRESEGNDSEEYRGYLGAAVGVLEMLQPNSAVKIYCRHAAIVRGINEWVDLWKARGWTRPTGEISGLEIWQRFVKVRDERRLDVIAEHCPEGTPFHDEQFNWLLEAGRERAKARFRTTDRKR